MVAGLHRFEGSVRVEEIDSATRCECFTPHVFVFCGIAGYIPAAYKAVVVIMDLINSIISQEFLMYVHTGMLIEDFVICAIVINVKVGQSLDQKSPSRW